MSDDRLFVALYVDAKQFRNRELGEFRRRLIRFLDAVTADEMRNSVRYLSEFR